jgi:diadenosine tetraphosphatase ApaH/serine/threonine PP2A family protein phosphatase
MGKLGTQFDQVCFNGHTHVPGVFVERGPGKWEFLGPEECVRSFRVAARRVICNVGAVGQPRDGDWRACYVLFDGDTIWFRRVEYDVEATIRKIYAVPALDNFFGNRLREGR